MQLTLERVKNNSKIQGFIKQTEHYLDALGFTDHGPRHVGIVSDRAKALGEAVGLSKKEQELAAIAGYCHDMGNFLGRTNHHYWAAMLFSQVFLCEAVDSKDVSTVMQAIVTHDKNTLKIVNKVSAVLILADKSDVHRDRVKDKTKANLETDIHDRVNYSVVNNKFTVDKKNKKVVLKLKIDPKVTDPLEYFEIFIERMTFCRQAADYLGYKFVLIVNNFKLSS